MKTFKEIKEHKEQITSKGLQTAIIYFFSPILNEVEERHIYADSITELRAWLNETCMFYNMHNICYLSYLNGVLETNQGDIVDKILDLES